eukprot:363194-Chlamydomonas_euryale.AAC.1
MLPPRRRHGVSDMPSPAGARLAASASASMVASCPASSATLAATASHTATPPAPVHAPAPRNSSANAARSAADEHRATAEWLPAASRRGSGPQNAAPGGPAARPRVYRSCRGRAATWGGGWKDVGASWHESAVRCGAVGSGVEGGGGMVGVWSVREVVARAKREGM